MAVTTFAELSTAIQNYAVRSDTTFTNRIPEFITSFEVWANRRMRVRQMETSTNLTPVAGVATIPSDFLELRCVTWTGSPRRVLDYVTPQVFDATDADRPSDTPLRYTIQGGSLKVMPLDNTALELDYYQKIPALSVSNTTNWLLTAHPDFYLSGCLFNAFKFTRNMEAVAGYKGERDEMLAEILDLDRKQQWGRGPLAIRTVGAVV